MWNFGITPNIEMATIYNWSEFWKIFSCNANGYRQLKITLEGKIPAKKKFH